MSWWLPEAAPHESPARQGDAWCQQETPGVTPGLLRLQASMTFQRQLLTLRNSQKAAP